MIFGVVCLLVSGIAGNKVWAEEDLTAEFAKIEKLYDKISETEQSQKLQLMKQIVAISDQLIKRYPEEPKVYWKAASSYSNLAYYDIENRLEILQQGREYAQKSIELAPDKGRGYYWRGTLMGQIGQEKGIFASLSGIKPMRDNLKKAIKLEPDFAPAYNVLAQLYLKAPGWPVSIGDVDKALQYRKKSIDLNSKNCRYQWRLYKTYLEAGKKEQADKVLDKVLKMTENPENVTGDPVKIRKKAQAVIK